MAAVKIFPLLILALIPFLGGLVSCSSQMKAKRPVSYHFEYGRTAMLKNGIAYAPRNAPPEVKRAIAAGNRLQGKPYKWGGGHARFNDSGYDCSGSVSYILREAGLLKGAMPSSAFFGYGKKRLRQVDHRLHPQGPRVHDCPPACALTPAGVPTVPARVGTPAPAPHPAHVVRHPSGL